MASVVLFCVLQGCAGVQTNDYAGELPVLDLRTYFNGPIEAWGMFQDRSGKAIKRFKVNIDAKWDGDTGTLDERFLYADGTTQRRVWTIKRENAQRYTGTADDVVGIAIGEAAGNVLRWKYVMALPLDGKVINVDFDDWMMLVDGRGMLNRSVMSKFGIRLGEVTLGFTKP
ncbi:MAG: DUF3833 domain-containing protein [Betaproteobacteria bacterium]